jgi:DNA-binding NtrC family response regulator
MGGDCWAESVEGKGSTFYLLISTKKTQRPAKPPWSSASHAHQRAALLTDMPCRFDSLRRNLKNWNVQVEPYRSLAEVDQQSGVQPFDMVILDITSAAHAQQTIAEARIDCPGASVILLVEPADIEVYKKGAVGKQWTVLSKPTTTHALYSATARVRTEQDPQGRVLAAAEIGRKASPMFKRKMSSLMDKAYGEVRA